MPRRLVGRHLKNRNCRKDSELLSTANALSMVLCQYVYKPSLKKERYKNEKVFVQQTSGLCLIDSPPAPRSPKVPKARATRPKASASAYPKPPKKHCPGLRSSTHDLYQLTTYIFHRLNVAKMFLSSSKSLVHQPELPHPSQIPVKEPG